MTQLALAIPPQPTANIEDHLPAPILGAFRLMAIAEEEIAAAGAGHVPDLFMDLLPDSTIRGMSPDVYRAHARELCQRAARGQPRVATTVECMCALYEASTRAPLNTRASAAYWLAFRAVMPGPVVMRAQADGCGEFTATQLKEGQEMLEDTRRDITRRLGR